jgi:hypothetical protein
LYVHPDFHGSASLKAVLPVLCPDLSYQNMAISDGQEAMMTWFWIQTGELSPEELEQTREAMRAYCEMDTYALVMIFKHLIKIVRR